MNLEKYRLLDKYIVKQLLETFLMGMVIFTSIMFASDTFITLVKQISMYGIPFNMAIVAVILKLPAILVLTIPMGVLFSVIMTINKMSLNSEITIMRACGIGINRIVKPVLAFAIVAAVSSLFLSEIVVPAASKQAKNLTIWALGQKNIPDGSKNFSFKELRSGNRLKRLFYVDSCEKKTMNGVTVLDLSRDNTIQIIQSKHGSSKPDYWKFNKGVIYTVANSGQVLNTTIFDNLKLFNSFNIIEKFKKTKATEMNFFSLAKYIYQNKKTNNVNVVDLMIELHQKLALPVTTFIFALLGFPLAITPPREKTNRGFLFCILIIFLYYLLSAFATALGQSGTLIPIISAWMPNVILGLLGVYLFYRKAYLI